MSDNDAISDGELSDGKATVATLQAEFSVESRVGTSARGRLFLLSDAGRGDEHRELRALS